MKSIHRAESRLTGVCPHRFTNNPAFTLYKASRHQRQKFQHPLPTMHRAGALPFAPHDGNRRHLVAGDIRQATAVGVSPLRRAYSVTRSSLSKFSGWANLADVYRSGSPHLFPAALEKNPFACDE